MKKILASKEMSLFCSGFNWIVAVSTFKTGNYGFSAFSGFLAVYCFMNFLRSHKLERKQKEENK